MNNKEFQKYKRDFLDSMRIKEDGAIENNNNLRFNITADDGSVETMVAKSFAEVVYRTCLNLLAKNIPSQKELSKLIPNDPSENIETLAEDIKKNIDKLLKLTNFEEFSSSIKDDSIIIKYNNKEYTITLEKSNDIDRNTVLPIAVNIEDDIVVVWIKNNNTTICHIVNCPYTINDPFSGVVFDTSIESLDRLYNSLIQYLKSLSIIAYYIGYASFNPEDKLEDEDFALVLSYKRAILEKIEMDRKNSNLIISEIKKLIIAYELQLNKKIRTHKLLKKRDRQITRSIKEMLSDLE